MLPSAFGSIWEWDLLSWPKDSSNRCEFVFPLPGFRCASGRRVSCTLWFVIYSEGKFQGIWALFWWGCTASLGDRLNSKDWWGNWVSSELVTLCSRTDLLHAWCKGPAKLCRCRSPAQRVHKVYKNRFYMALMWLKVKGLWWEFSSSCGWGGWVWAQLPLVWMGPGWVSHSCSKHLVGTNTHIPCIYGKEGGFRGIKVIGGGVGGGV